MNFVEEMKKKACEYQNSLVLPEGAEERTVIAAAEIVKEKIAREVILLGKEADIKKTAESKGVSLDGITLIDPENSLWNDEFAKEWAKAMEDCKNGTVRDFVAVGDVDIKVIGEGAPILDSQVPVRQILEQLVAKTGLPPFLLGLNWSTTERMSTQQADILSSELWAMRRTVEPILKKICRTFLALEGLDDRVEILWDDISLQDITEEARAELYLAQAAKYRKEAEQ